jgi:hypothetical protein
MLFILKIKSEKSKGQKNMIRNKEMHKARNLALLTLENPFFVKKWWHQVPDIENPNGTMKAR